MQRYVGKEVIQIGIVFVLAVGLALGVFMVSMGSDSVPRLDIDPIVDMGVVNPVSDNEFRIPFRNAGSSPLEIIEVLPSCGCTVVNDIPRIVEPQSEGEIVLSYKAGFGVGREVGGLMLKIVSNDPDAPTIHVRIAARYPPDVVSMPQSIRFGTLVGSATGSAELVIAAIGFEDPPELELSGWSSDLPGLSVGKSHEGQAVSSLVNPDNSRVLPLKLEYSPSAAQVHGDTEGVVRLELGFGDDVKALEIPVSAHVVPRLRPIPSILMIRTSSAGDNQPSVRFVAEDEFKIVRVIPSAGLHATADRRSERKEHTVNVSHASGPLSDKPSRETLKIMADINGERVASSVDVLVLP